MSFERVFQYIARHDKQITFVCVKDGRAQCMAADDKKVRRVMLGMYENVKPVGFYTVDINPLELGQDLQYCGVEI